MGGGVKDPPPRAVIKFLQTTELHQTQCTQINAVLVRRLSSHDWGRVREEFWYVESAARVVLRHSCVNEGRGGERRGGLGGSLAVFLIRLEN